MNESLNETIRQRNITLLSALFGLFFGVMTLFTLLISGMPFKTSGAAAMIAFAVAMLIAHIFMSVRDALEVRRYNRFEESLGETVTARIMCGIFTGDDSMNGMIYVLKGGLLLASVSRGGNWKQMLRPGEMHHAEQIDPATLQLNCLDGRIFRIMTASMDELIDELRAMGVSVIELPMP